MFVTNGNILIKNVHNTTRFSIDIFKKKVVVNKLSKSIRCFLSYVLNIVQ